MSCHICEIFTNALNGWKLKLEQPIKKVNYTGAPAYCIPDYEVEHAYYKFEYDDILEKYNVHKRKCKKTHVGNGTHKGAWAFTLTQSPKDELTKDDMIAAVRKIMSQKSCPVKKYAWYLEKADESHFHIHGMYETFTEGRIEKKHFKRAWPIWGEEKGKALGAGFRGGYHRPVRAEEAYSEYISKDGGLSETNVPT